MKTADLTIFYADDDLEDLDLFTEVTNDINSQINVVTHDRGDKLLQALQNRPPLPHIIFLDLNMPGRNGFDILEELKANQDLKGIPVVIFSTSNDEAIIARSRSLGANFYLPKLPSYEKFRKSIEDTLNINWNTFKPNASNFLYSA
jgi:CheY-like chemotaxis protein